MSAPLPLVATFIAGAYLINGSSGWVELTQLLRAGPRFLVGLNPQCSHPVGSKKCVKHTTIKQIKLPTQCKQKFFQLIGFLLHLLWNGSDNDPSLFAQRC